MATCINCERVYFLDADPISRMLDTGECVDCVWAAINEEMLRDERETDDFEDEPEFSNFDGVDNTPDYSDFGPVNLDYDEERCFKYDY